jgi:hypothetical protein
MNILIEDSNVKAEGENILKPTIGNDSLHQIVMTMVLKEKNLTQQKTCFLKAQSS